MAKEYIEREALIDEINIAPVSMSICMNVDECKGRIYERERLVRIINEAIAADVVSRDCYDRLLASNDALRKERPVRHGRWIVTAEFTDCVYAQCDQCNITQVFYHNKPLTNFCPNCGADMKDGDGE